MKIRIFTDGACSGNPGPGGWGALIFFPNEKQEISGGEKDTTNNRMELKAVIESLKLVLKLGHSKIDVYSDSAYVINAIKHKWYKKWASNGWRTSKNEDVKNKDLWLALIGILDKHRDITLIKVKGHSGNTHNERVDVIAKKEVQNMIQKYNLG